ncbi:GATOR complex protein NPRL2-like [Argonauta hians]
MSTVNQIKGIFFCEFHPTQGPIIAYQIPEDLIKKETFDALHIYIIPKKELFERDITVNALGHKILGYPVHIDSPKYARNALIFNLCFVFDQQTCTTDYEPVVKKLSAYMTQLELESGYLSNEESRKEIPKLMHDVLQALNTHGMCHVPMSKSTTIHLKVTSRITMPPAVADHDVPILVKDSGSISEWDLTTKQILPYLDGFNHVAFIATEADVEINLVKACLQNLQHYGVIKLISIFQYSNVHATTPDIYRLSEDKDLQDECVKYVRTQGHSLPDFKDIFHLLCEMNPGTTVRDICCQFNPRALRIDERKLIQFGLIKGLIRRIHRYPVKIHSRNIQSRLQSLYHYFNGLHSYDEICGRMGMSYNELDELIESDSSVVVYFK